ncbi:MAG: TonB-dependent receptor [Pyrinomonadaceae bacterium]|nr:TonB-dependent receptor [Pyrinomonadaceae bacterium]
MNNMAFQKSFARHLVMHFVNTTAVLLALSLTATAQSKQPSLSGHVVDQNNAAVNDARITLQQTDTGIERITMTDANGAFTFQHLTQGEYHLRVIGAGFSSASQTLALSTGDDRNVDFTLQAGPLAEEVVVTSALITGTPETLQHIPGSVEIINQKLLETSRSFTSSEALRKVAGVQVRDEEGFGLRPNIGIRGLNPTRSSKVLLLEDGLPLTYAPYGDNASYYHPPIDRFESIEVLKGSGQILYGPTTVGGVVNYVTPNPPIEPSGFVMGTFGSRDYFNGHLNYGGTWRNTGLLFDYTRKQGAGSRENTHFGLNDFNFKSVSTLGAKQALTLKFNHYGEDSNVTYSGLTEAEYRESPRQNPFKNDSFYGDRYGASAAHAYVFNSNAVLTTNFYGAYFRRHWWRQSSNSNQRPNRLRTLSGGDPDCTGIADLNTTCGNEGRLRQYHFLGAEPRLHVTHQLFNVRNEADFGLRVHFETQQRRQENGDSPTSRSGLLVENNERRNQAYSGFAQNRFIFGEWTITPGIRLEHVKYERTNRLANAGRGVFGRTNLTQIVPGLGVSYTPTDKLTVFGGVHRGFAPPRTEDVINNTTGGVVELDPELSWNYELGLRSTPYAGVKLEATFFRMDYENQIVAASLAGGVGSQLTNGGETLHQGAEVAGRVDTGAIFKSRHNVYVRGAYTFLPDARFTGVRFSSVGGFNRTSITGNRLPYASDHTLNAIIGYSHPSGIDALMEANYVSEQYADDLNTIQPTADGQRGLIPKYTVWNATLNYNVERLRTTFFVTVKNVFDHTYIVDRTRGILPSSPRLVQGGLKYRF